MGFALSGAAGAAGETLQKIIARRIMEQFQRQRMAEEVRQADMGHEIAHGQLDLGDRRISEDGRQFDVTSGQSQQRIDLDKAEQPVKLRFMGAQSANLERQPQKEADERRHDFELAGLKGGQELQQIAASGKEQERVARIRTANTGSGTAAWSLKDYTNPQTNETQTFRVNELTGEMLPVQAPAGLQPGGSKQTRLSAAQQDDLATMKTVQDMSVQVRELGKQTGGKGVGGLGAGTVGQLRMRHLGQGDPSQEQLRNFVGNIQGTIAKLRGGTAFTAQEKAMLDNYTPTINESWPSITAKLDSLDKFISLKRDNMLQFAGANPSGAAPGGGKTAAGAQEYDWVDGKLVPRGQK